MASQDGGDRTYDDPMADRSAMLSRKAQGKDVARGYSVKQTADQAASNPKPTSQQCADEAWLLDNPWAIQQCTGGKT